VNVQIFLKKKLYCTKLEQIVNTEMDPLHLKENEPSADSQGLFKFILIHQYSGSEKRPFALHHSI
jgi:hypothetical protein